MPRASISSKSPIILMNPFLSIIIPAHNEEKRLELTLQEVENFSEVQPYSVEVLVVENASQDRTLQIAKVFAQNRPKFHVLHEDERGKGRAIKRGMLVARGK
jgi:dolichyl-phosphate beta-glucosyltransferase